jgi:hypothetical protein
MNDKKITHDITKAAYHNADPSRVKGIVEELFKEDKLNTMLHNGYKMKKVGRPNQLEQRIKEIMNTSKVALRNEDIEIDEGRRVVPLYEGFGEGPATLLTPYEHRFVVAFVPLNNAAEAARIAASPEDRERTRNWNKVGNDLIRRPQVQSAIGYMQKKLCVAAALDSVEIISNIREIAAMALAAGKYDAAIKANQILGEHLGMFGKNNNIKNVTPTTIDIFKTGEDLVDNHNDIQEMASKLGFKVKAGE